MRSCPWCACDGDPFVDESSGEFGAAWVKCAKCKAEGPLYLDRDGKDGGAHAGAIAAWNARTDSPAVIALMKLDEAVRRYQARLQSIVDEGTPEAAVHAERALGMLGEELRR